MLVKETVAMENATKPLKSVIVTETKHCVTIKILILEAALFHKTVSYLLVLLTKMKGYLELFFNYFS